MLVFFLVFPLLLFFLFSVESAKHAVETIKGNHCSQPESNKCKQRMAVKLVWAVKPETNPGWYDKAQSYIPANSKKEPERTYPFS